MSVLVTGANGFVGSRLCRELRARGRKVLAAVRVADSVEQVGVGALDESTDWRPLLRRTEVIVHLAARVHVMREREADRLAAFRTVNAMATEALARQAAQAGVRRFVFVSSVKVHGEASVHEPFRESDRPEPQDPYAVSKWEAEQRLAKVCAESEMELCVVRPPLVYGPGVRGNFLRLLRLARSGLPLPLAGVRNARSLIALDNLVRFLALCAEHPRAAGETFLISDGRDFSTAELIEVLADAMGRRARVFSVPEATLMALARVLRQEDIARRLCGSLRVDAAKSSRLVGWRPSVTAEHALAETARWYGQMTKGRAFSA